MTQPNYKKLLDTNWIDKFNDDQIEVIVPAIKRGLDVSKIADPSIPAKHMKALCEGCYHNLDLTPYYDPTKSPSHLSVIMRMLQTEQDITPLMENTFDESQLQVFYEAIVQSRLDISEIVDPNLTCFQMEAHLIKKLTGAVDVDWAGTYDHMQLSVLRRGAAYGLNIWEFANPNLEWYQMEAIMKSDSVW